MPDSAGNKFKSIAPLDAAGVVFNRPTGQILWSGLTNVFQRDGFVETRPGLVPVGPTHQDLTDGPRPIVAIAESKQYSNERTLACERLAPTSTPSSGSWTGNHTTVDENPPNDGSDVATTSTDDDTIRFGYANLSGSFDVIDSVVLYVRARSPNGGLNFIEVAYGGKAGSPTTAANLIDLIQASTDSYEDSSENTIPGFMDFFIPITSPQGDDIWWTVTAVNAFSSDLTLRSIPEPGTVFLGPSATGSDNGFLPAAGEAWKRTDGVADAPAAFFIDNDSTVTGATGTRLSIDFDALDSSSRLSSVDSVTVKFGLTSEFSAPPSRVTIYFKGTDSVRYEVVASTAVLYHDPSVGDPWDAFVGWTFIGAEILLNPETGVAWTITELKAGLEFGVQVDSGSVIFSTADIFVAGQLTTANVELDNVQLLVCGRDFVSGSNGDDVQAWTGRVMATAGGFQRLLLETSSPAQSLEDILGATTNPTGTQTAMDWTIFFDRIYFTNGFDLPYFYEDKTVSQLSAGTPIGRTIFNFGQRLMQGDVLDAGVRSPKRVAWSGIAAPDDWTASDAGDLDLTHGGSGRVRKGLALSSTVAALYLDKGIYNLRWTGDTSAPFVPRIQDPDTGIIAPQTAKAVLDRGGTATHLFLGSGPQGTNIYSYDGEQAQPVGFEINKELVRLANAGTLEHAFAAVEPQQNLYMIFVPEGTQLYPEQCWTYSLDRGEWARWTFPFGITSVGIWTLFNVAEDNPAPSGEETLILGTTLGIPYKFNYNTPADVLTPPGSNIAGTITTAVYSVDASNSPAFEQEIAYDIQTGDLLLSDDDITRLTSVKRIWLTYEDRGVVDIEVSLSTDGGTSYVNATDIRLGTTGPSNLDEDDVGELREAVIDFATPQAGRHQRLRLRPDQSEDTTRQKLKISKIVFEYEDLGELP